MKRMSHLAEEEERLGENRLIKELYFTEPRLLSPCLRDGEEKVIRASCRGKPGRHAWKNRKKKKRRRPRRETLKRIMKKLFHNHSSFLNDLHTFSIPFIRCLLSRLANEAY